jgi:hypothetical protein
MRRKYRSFNDADLLQDGEGLRVPMFAMDGMDPVQRAVARHSARVTDANGGSGLALRRPGFRFVLDDAAGAQAKEVAYRRADAEMVNAWRNPPTNVTNTRVCPECDGSGLDKNGQDDCSLCGGAGVIDADYESGAQEVARNAETYHESLARRRSDNRSVNQILQDHQANMARIYAHHDRKLSEAWRRS